jgi:predicted chitinase
MSITTIDRLLLYNPNENIGGEQFQSFGFGNPDSNDVVNHEDLIMYCNLRAFTRPRSYILNSNSDGIKLQSVASARINFLKPNPEKNKFTTDWTELDASGRPNGEEMLGINSIQITYDTSYVPRVTITMTDVRGQALNEDPGDSPYGAFFNFPYPMFVLEVKGYYGKAVKYLLHLLKYSSKFNYESGNFEITCEFVGFTYALLSDLNVQYGLVASQMVINGKSGDEILKKKYEEQKILYPELTNDINSILNTNIYTMVGLINKSKDLSTFVETLSQDNDRFREKSGLDGFIDVLQNLYDDINKGNQTIRNNAFNERVLLINGNLLFQDFPEYGKQLKCNLTAPNDRPIDFISESLKNSFNKYFEDSKKIISQNINNLLKIIDGEVKSELTEKLGFEPTIRNIMLIICNNYELFLDLLTETSKNAATIRKPKLDDLNKRGLNNNRNNNKKLEEIYPWPVLYDNNYNICYFDSLPSLNINDYPENDFVESYLNATIQTNKLLEVTGQTLNVSDETINQVLFNPIHTQQYNNTIKSSFKVDLTGYLIQMVEHALLLGTNTWGERNINQVEKFGDIDAENLINVLGDGIKDDLTTLSNNLKWLNDSIDNSVNNTPIGILQILLNKKTIITTNDKDNFDKLKQQFQYIKEYFSDYITDIVENESITNLKGKYDSLNSIRFIPEIKNNLLPGINYGEGSVTTGNNGFITYERNSKFIFPEKISLESIFKPFMEEREGSGSLIYNPELIKNYNNLLNSLKSFLIFTQTNTNGGFSEYIFNLGIKYLFDSGNGVKDILDKTPGIVNNKDLILFNGVHKVKMASALNYLFLNDNNFLDPNFVGDYRNLSKYRYYFPFTTESYRNSYTDDINIYNNNTKTFLNVYREIIETIVEIMKTSPTVNDGEISENNFYAIISGGKFLIDKNGDLSNYSNQNKNKEQYKQIYEVLREFFETDIEMVCKSNGISDVYNKPLEYWTNNNNWDETLTNSNIINYDNKIYNRFKPSYIISKYLQGFKKRIKEIKDSFDNNTNPTSNTTAVKTANDLKISLYQTFKNINDKWVIDDGSTNQYTWSLSGDVDDNERPVINRNRRFLFEHFFYVDRVNKDIGSEMLLDFRILKDYYEMVNSKNSFYSLIGELAKKNEMIFHPLTSYINFGGFTSNNQTEIDNLFKPLTVLDFESTTPAFIMQYIGKNASYQYENQNHIPDVVKIDFSDNIPKLNAPIFKDLNDGNVVNNPVAFFVDMGIKNQNMFKGITLDQAEFRETNESITVWDQLTSQKENRSIQTIGNNIYPILSRRSYTCRVESLGNMMIQPTMYFYLRYVPLFSGLYLITKVSHSIQPNNVVTNFEGVRMSTFNYPLVSQFVSTLTKEILENNNNTFRGVSVNEDVNFWDNLKNSNNSSDIIMKERIITFYNAIKNKIDNLAVQAAMIAIAYKETNLQTIEESSYGGTYKFSTFNSFTELREYTTEGPNNTETSKFILELRKKKYAFFNFVYGTGETGKNLGNNPTKNNPINITDSDGAVITVYDDINGDGYKYRGRGFNQITGRYNYDFVKKRTGVDVITNPDLLKNTDTATLALFYFMDRGAKGTVRQPTNQRNEFYQVYSDTNLSNFDKENFQKAYNTLFSINAGPNNSMETHLNNRIKKDGYQKGYNILQSIFNAIKKGEIK